jgi:glycerophosphoryl diester phosphodiesterase
MTRRDQATAPMMSARQASALVLALAYAILQGCGGGGSVRGTDGLPPLPDPNRVVTLPPSDPEVVAHRGGAAYAPENTLVAFENAARLGADFIEMDVHLSADGKLVVIHDDDLTRTTNCTLRVSESRADEVVGCDAAYWWQPGVAITSRAAQSTPLRGFGITVPLLVDVLAWNAALGSSAPSLSIEIKAIEGKPSMESAAASAVVADARNAGVTQKTVIQSFRPEILNQVKSAEPTIKTALVVGPGGYTSCLLGVQYAIAHKHDFIYVQSTTADLTANCVAYAHENGKKILVWIVDRARELQQARALSADQVLTNFPACIFDELERPYEMPYYTPLITQTSNLLKCAVN